MASDGRTAGWPAIGWETHRRVPTIQPEMVSRSVRESHAGPYRTAVTPAIADIAPALDHATLVGAAMSDLMRFVQRNDLPILVHAALAHAQFDTIHPFPDGNGRTGRTLVHAMLRGKGLTRNVTIPVSAGLLMNTRAYFDALTAYRDGRPDRIVTLLADASFAAILNGRELVSDLRETQARWHTLITARRDSAAWALADLLLRQPVIDAATVQRELAATSANAQRAIRTLAAAGIITEFTDRKRNRLWQATEVLSALDAFAARAVRSR